MSLIEQLQEDKKQALKGKNTVVIDALRMLSAALINAEIEKKREKLSEEEVVGVIKREVKKLKDALEDFQRAKREDLIAKTQKEIEILQKYLPLELGEEEIRKVVQKKIEELGAAGAENFGRVMKEVMAELKGKADGAAASRIVKEELKE